MSYRQLNRCQNQPSQRRGAALVEFAMVAPILFLLLLTFIEFGHFLLTIHALEEASRTGCRIAVLEESTTKEVENQVASILGAFGVKNYNLSITPSLLTSIEAGAPVSVTISAQYKDVSWLPAPPFLQNQTFSITNTTPKEK